MSEMLQSQPLVTVIMPFLNPPARFFHEAIESVKAQTYANWELLLIDDGANRALRTLAQTYSDASPQQIRYLHHPDYTNRGASASRNLGLDVAKGDLVAFLDADDIWLKDKLAAQVQLLLKHPSVDMHYSQTRYWFGWTGKAKDRERDFYPALGLQVPTVIKGVRLLALSLQARIAVPCMCSVMVRLDALKNCGGFEKQFTGFYDDQVLFAKLWTKGQVFVTDHCWDLYRQHPSSMMMVGSDIQLQRKARLAYLRWLSVYLLEQGVTDRTINRAVKLDVWLNQRPWVGPVLSKFRRMFWKLLARFAPTSFLATTWRGTR